MVVDGMKIPEPPWWLFVLTWLFAIAAWWLVAMFK